MRGDWGVQSRQAGTRAFGPLGQWVRESPDALLIADAAKLWGVRPSEMLGMSNRGNAAFTLQFDLAIAQRYWVREAELAQQRAREAQQNGF